MYHIINETIFIILKINHHIYQLIWHTYHTTLEKNQKINLLYNNNFNIYIMILVVVLIKRKKLHNRNNTKKQEKCYLYYCNF